MLGSNGVDQILRARFFELQRHPRPVFAERSNRRCYHRMEGRRTGKPDRQAALVATRIVSGRFHRKLDILKNCPGLLDECLASLRDLDAARHPPKQCRADHGL